LSIELFLYPNITEFLFLAKYSVECGPFMLHFIESLAFGSYPTMERALNIRKKMLKVFANDGDNTWKKEDMEK
jgi:hypothetical protein